MSWLAAATIAGGALGYLGQQSANEANAKEAARNRAFQAEQSATAYQRSTEDLRRAGLNPILAAGSPASTPSGSTAHFEDAMSKGVNSAIEIRRLKKEMDAVQSQSDLNKATAGAQEAQKISALATAKNTETQNKKAQLETKLLQSQEGAIIQESKARAAKAAYDEKLAPLDAVTSRLNTASGIVNNALDALNPRRYLKNSNPEIPQTIIKEQTKPSTIKELRQRNREENRQSFKSRNNL